MFKIIALIKVWSHVIFDKFLNRVYINTFDDTRPRHRMLRPVQEPSLYFWFSLIPLCIPRRLSFAHHRDKKSPSDIEILYPVPVCLLESGRERQKSASAVFD